MLLLGRMQIMLLGRVVIERRQGVVVEWPGGTRSIERREDLLLVSSRRRPGRP